MGFWDFVGDTAKSAMNQMSKVTQEVRTLTDDYQNKDNRFLEKKFRSGRWAEKAAATKVLKERGYGPNS